MVRGIGHRHDERVIVPRLDGLPRLNEFFHRKGMYNVPCRDQKGRFSVGEQRQRLCNTAETFESICVRRPFSA